MLFSILLVQNVDVRLVKSLDFRVGLDTPPFKERRAVKINTGNAKGNTTTLTCH